MAAPRSSYSDLLKDPRWQKKRLEILERDSWSCGNCGDKDSTLHVHHGRYLRGLKPWEYDADILYTLCEMCHSKAGADNTTLDQWIARCDPSSLSRIIGYVAAIAADSYSEGFTIPCYDYNTAVGIAEATGLVGYFTERTSDVAAEEIIKASHDQEISLETIEAMKSDIVDRSYDDFLKARALSRKVDQLMEAV